MNASDGYLHATELPHTFFTLFLLFEQFFLTGHVAAVALRKNVLTHCLDRFARYDLTAYRRLYGISNSWRGMTSLSFSASTRPRACALSRCMIMESASQTSPFKSMSSFTMSLFS